MEMTMFVTLFDWVPKQREPFEVYMRGVGIPLKCVHAKSVTEMKRSRSPAATPRCAPHPRRELCSCAPGCVEAILLECVAAHPTRSGSWAPRAAAGAQSCASDPG
eukprot:3957369-Prymnesium_polylepis.1